MQWIQVYKSLQSKAPLAKVPSMPLPQICAYGRTHEAFLFQVLVVELWPLWDILRIVAWCAWTASHVNGLNSRTHDFSIWSLEFMTDLSKKTRGSFSMTAWIPYFTYLCGISRANVLSRLFKLSRAFCVACFLKIVPVTYSFFLTTRTILKNYNYFHQIRRYYVVLSSRRILIAVVIYLIDSFHAHCVNP